MTQAQEIKALRDEIAELRREVGEFAAALRYVNDAVASPGGSWGWGLEHVTRSVLNRYSAHVPTERRELIEWYGVPRGWTPPPIEGSCG